MNNEQWRAALEERVSLLEERRGVSPATGPNIVEIDLLFPEDEIDGLFFNKQRVNALFEKGDGGWYYSRDILFLSARNVADDNSRDLLQRYLDDAGGDREIQEQIADVFGVTPTRIEIALPRKSQGIKKYHGVGCWYWLRPCCSGSAVNFYGVGSAGCAHHYYASAVGGCAPAFRINASPCGEEAAD
jgi:hypothetical protein